jgi:hypothetical protein
LPVFQPQQLLKPEIADGGTVATDEVKVTACTNCCTLPAGTPQTITGTIYCDNYFEFWFNGQLVAKDPINFVPHNAVGVSFEWDGTSDKEYAIMCMDYASDSGYEYTETTTPGLGDGSLMVGTPTSGASFTFFDR